MSRIYITGDIHGDLDIHKLNTKNFPVQKKLTRDDYLIIAGDFGLIWDGGKSDQYWLKWLVSKPWTTLFIDGNHENFDLLYSYPTEQWNGGTVRKIRDNIIHLERGQIFNLYGQRFFTFGGATSIDKKYRKEFVSWWSQEIPKLAEMDRGLQVLKENNMEVDYVITHTCPSYHLSLLGHKAGLKLEGEALNSYFENIYRMITYKHWYFGHFHYDMELTSADTLLYHEIKRIL